ncbi:MAG: DUF4234 domain-containing protein [Pseudomonadota bacterium]
MGDVDKVNSIQESEKRDESRELSGREVVFIRCGMLIYALVFFAVGLCVSYPLPFGRPGAAPPIDLLVDVAILVEILVWLVVFPFLTGTILCWYGLKWPLIPIERKSETTSISPSSYIAPPWLHINPYAIISFVLGVVYIWFGCGFLIFIMLSTGYPTLAANLKHAESAAVFVSLIIVAGVRRCILAVKKGRLPIGWEGTLTYSNYLPIWRMVVMSLITCGLYHLQWFADVSEQLKKTLQVKLGPGRQSLGLIFPVYNSILAHQFFIHINHAAERAGVARGPSPLLLTVWYTLVYGGVIYVLVFEWRSAVWVISVSLLALVVSGTCLLAAVQNTLNAIWLKEQTDLPVRDSFSKDQWSEVVQGWCMWSLIAHFLPGYWPG